MWLSFLAVWAWAATPSPASGGTHSFEKLKGSFDCASAPCAAVLPAADRFERVEGKPYFVGIDNRNEPVGWVIRSTDVTDRTAYSGKPIVTVVGIDLTGEITGARIVHHSEPILLLGIPEQTMQDFVEQYTGRHATDPIEVGGQGTHGVDAISGATVTVLAENVTLLEAARALGVDVGVIERTVAVPGHWAPGAPATWRQLTKEGLLGRLVVSADAMNLPATDPAFADLWFGFADAERVGVPLLGERTWRWHTDRLEPGEHLFVVVNAGTASFRGSGFVRGGIFDRIRVEQGLHSVIFTDMDYTRIDSPPVGDAPAFPEAALFIARGLDPGVPLEFLFLGSAYDGKGAFTRDFHTFSATFATPRSLWVLDGPDPRDVVWRQAWATGWAKGLLVGCWFLGVAGLFVGRRWLTASMKRLQRVHLAVMGASFLVLGVAFHIQPSITQLLTLVGQLRGDTDARLFLSDPVLFVSWIGIAIVSVIWGRGVFCGWICPYGALTELIFKAARKLGIPHWEPSADGSLQRVGRYLRYAVLAVLLGAFLWQPETGERLAEIEPFKSTFFVPLFSRHPGLIAWWSVLIIASVTTYRPFCRFLCPLGAALAVGSSFRVSGPYRREFCSKCKICTRGCEPRAIGPDGRIDPRECLSCMECETNWADDTVCPPLVAARRHKDLAIGKRKSAA